jgi:hypothetical protein
MSYQQITEILYIILEEIIILNHTALEKNHRNDEF